MKSDANVGYWSIYIVPCVTLYHVSRFKFHTMPIIRKRALLNARCWIYFNNSNDSNYQNWKDNGDYHRFIERTRVVISIRNILWCWAYQIKGKESNESLIDGIFIEIRCRNGNETQPLDAGMEWIFKSLSESPHVLIEYNLIELNEYFLLILSKNWVVLWSTWLNRTN